MDYSVNILYIHCLLVHEVAFYGIVRDLSIIFHVHFPKDTSPMGTYSLNTQIKHLCNIFEHFF